MLNALLGIVLMFAIPQVAGALVAWWLGWRGAAIWAWPLVAATDFAITWHVHDSIQAARATAAGHYLCGLSQIALFMGTALHLVVGTILVLGTRLILDRGRAAGG
jgi:hypothetical protein